MKNCPQCGQARLGEAFKCPKCDVFCSHLDEILFEEQQKLEKHTLKAILANTNRKQAIRDEFKAIWGATPLKTKIALWTIFAFVFALVFGI